MENHSLSSLTKAVEKGLRINAHTKDAIVQFLYRRESPEYITFSLEGREHLKYVNVDTPEIGQYSQLLMVGGGL